MVGIGDVQCLKEGRNFFENRSTTSKKQFELTKEKRATTKNGLLGRLADAEF